MKRKEIKELFMKQEPELHKMLSESKEKLNSLHFELQSDKLKNVREIQHVRKQIARIQTALHKEKKA